RKGMGRDITLPTPDTFNPKTYQPFRGEPTGTLNDGDVIDLGSRQLVIYHTPGHSPGHICIFDETNGYLFTGDLLYDETPIYAFYPSTNPVDLVNSLEEISDCLLEEFKTNHNIYFREFLLVSQIPVIVCCKKCSNKELSVLFNLSII